MSKNKIQKLLKKILLENKLGQNKFAELYINIITKYSFASNSNDIVNNFEFIDLSTPSGMRVYVRSLSMVLSLAITELFPESTLRIEHPISKGYYCGLDNFDKAITPEIIETIKAKVNEIIQQFFQYFLVINIRFH